jgi:flagellar hook assembly protein FlgD
VELAISHDFFKTWSRPASHTNVNVKNNGNESLVFSDTKSDVVIHKLNGNQTYEPSTLGTLAVEPNGTKTFTWNQQDTKGQQVNKGIYGASITMGTLKANTTFNIS